MRELERQRGLEICNHLARSYREKLPAETAGDDAERHIDDAVDHENPHGGKMPKQRAGEPVAKRDLSRKDKVKQWRSIVDLPARADHDQDRQRVDPVTDAHPAWVDRRAGIRHGYRVSCHAGCPCLLRYQLRFGRARGCEDGTILSDFVPLHIICAGPPKSEAAPYPLSQCSSTSLSVSRCRKLAFGSRFCENGRAGQGGMKEWVFERVVLPKD